MSYTFIEVTLADQLEKVFAFRYKIICEKMGISKLENCEAGCETDEYDAYSEHFAAFDEEGEVVSCVRIIHHSPIGYPTTNHMNYKTDIWHFDPERLGELSRIFVAPQIRGIQNLKPLLDTFKTVLCDKLTELELSYTLGALEKPFFRLLRILHFPYRQIGDLQPYIGQRYPCILYTDELRTANPELFIESTLQ